MRTALPLAVLLSPLLVACTATPAPELAESAVEPGLLPFPYTAEEIRLGNPPGTVLVHRLERAGSPTVLRETHFVADDGTTAGMREVVRQDGDVIRESAGEATWVELRDHASFPADAAVRAEASCEVPAGRFDCWLYTVAGDDGSESRFWFARSRPGPPVLYEVEQGGEVVFRMTLVEAPGR